MMGSIKIAFVLLIGLNKWSTSFPTDEVSLIKHNESDLVSSSLIGNNTVPQPYIVGGVEARPNEFPWLVLVQIDGGFCGGSLIDMDLVLTAAHCVTKEETEKVISTKVVKIIAGAHEWRKNERTQQTSTVSGIRIHEKYKAQQFLNDIALIRLSKRLTETQAVKKIAFKNTTSGTASMGTVAGWGSLSYQGSLPRTLMKVTVPIISGTTCKNIMTNPSGQFCAGIENKDSCQGDSGGGMICNDNSNAVCGVVSYGFKCALKDTPGVYTNVAVYSPWIIKNFNFKGSSSVILSSSVLLLALFIIAVSSNSILS